MLPGEVNQLRQGSAVWVWVVRFGRGRWWPGTVESLQRGNALPVLTVKFECSRRPMQERPVMVGLVSTRMRYVELRDLGMKGADRPDFIPSSVLSAPETNSQFSAGNARDTRQQH